MSHVTPIKFQTMRELVIATLTRFEKAKGLACRDQQVQYDHSTNGVGCAISCHLSARNAKGLDTIGQHLGTHCISRLAGSPFAGHLLGGIFDDIDIRDLEWLQVAHDGACDLNDFRRTLYAYLGSPDADLTGHVPMNFETLREAAIVLLVRADQEGPRSKLDRPALRNFLTYGAYLPTPGDNPT